MNLKTPQQIHPLKVIIAVVSAGALGVLSQRECAEIFNKNGWNVFFELYSALLNNFPNKGLMPPLFCLRQQQN